MKKYEEYAQKIIIAVQGMFEANDDGTFIDPKGLADGDNATHFIHALASTAPCFIYRTLTGEDTDVLEMNHIANNLIFQFANKTD